MAMAKKKKKKIFLKLLWIIAKTFVWGYCWWLLRYLVLNMLYSDGEHILKVHNDSKLISRLWLQNINNFSPVWNLLNTEVVNISGKNSRTGACQISISIFKLSSSSSSHYSLQKQLRMLQLHGYMRKSFQFCHLLHRNYCPGLSRIN